MTEVHTSSDHLAPTDEIEVWRRHPSDAGRLALSLLILAVLVLAAALAPDAITGASADVVRIVRRLPSSVRSFLLGIAQALALAAPVVAVGWLAFRRRFRLLGTAAAGVAVAAVAMVLFQSWLDRRVPPSSSSTIDRTSWITGAAFPSGTYLAALTAAVIVLGSAANRSWRRVGAIAIATAGALRLITGASVPLNLGITLAAGAAAGSLALVVLGSPLRRLGHAGVLAGLRAIGFDAETIEEVDTGADNSRTFRAATHTGDRAFVKLIGRDERAAELFARSVRALRVKGLDDERAGWSPLATVRNEGLAGLLAGGAGVQVAGVLAVGGTEDGDGLTVLTDVPGTPLAELEAGAVTDPLLRAVWSQVAGLRRARIAHRWLDGTHVLVGTDGEPTILDFRWAAVGASDRLLAVDVADLLVGTAAVVGVDRAVAAAAAALTPEELATALPLLQPLVLSRPNKALAKGRPDLLDELRSALAEAAGVDEVGLEPVGRITVSRVVGLVGLVVMVYVALGFASNAAEIGDALADADWSYLPILLLLSASAFVTGAITMLGAIPQRLPFFQTVEVMYGQSFLNRFTPANAGGMALRVKYLQKHGAELTIAAASVGLTSLAGGVMQVVVIVILVLWVGSTPSVDINIPGVDSLAVVVLVVLLLAGVVWALPVSRRLIRERVLPALAKGWVELRGLAKNPAKMALLFGGAFLGKAGTLAAFVLSCRALGVDTSVAVLCLGYMTANTVASAAPTPGGVGAIEAALVAVLTSIGVESSQALSVVVVFRLVTYWLPIPFTFAALTHLRRTGVV